MRELFGDVVDSVTQNKHGWTHTTKACIIAATIVALRPKYSVEIGVYAGKGLIAMALAHKAISFGMAIGIDPYSADASKHGQANPDHAKFWSELNHEAVYQECLKQLQKWQVHGYVKLERKRSDEYDPPDQIGLLRVDGNHGPVVLQDVTRYAPFVQRGGIIIMDDLNWSCGSVVKACANLDRWGFRVLYEITEPEGEIWRAYQKL